MKISITHYGNTTSYESERDDQDIAEMVSIIKGMMVSVGFHPSSVDDYFVGAEGEWFPDLEEKTEMMSAETPTKDNRDDYYYRSSKGKVAENSDGSLIITEFED
tara:strand:- start:247 stop:558 length:312 start_codon:yes stop_codon:yes gene_type:complete